ncbi:hypothetical protein [Catellatospora coxensis]|uniref:Uncharacterized protein n=1 Tax=Catellatospora coxensis TaxID=310354 RepID=A0A8J3KW71_9ACTN|nr:hypothetical protein [Catellatospora coxensis]GIG09743.1 hypothetical protein Cco03nite_64430 [Catellatospora coxensis]
MPLSLLPGWARTIAPASPGYWALQALGGAATGDTAAVLRGCGVLLLIAPATGLYAAWRMNRGRGRSRLLRARLRTSIFIDVGLSRRLWAPVFSSR